MKFLQRVSAVALFGTLMSSSGLAYALALQWPVERCLAFIFQMLGVPLALHAYLRTCAYSSTWPKTLTSGPWLVGTWPVLCWIPSVRSSCSRAAAGLGPCAKRTPSS